jgi:6-phosphogluconolactonase (cycloisomerase 2 family)
MKILMLCKRVSIRLILIAVFILPLIAGLTTPVRADDDDDDDDDDRGGARRAVYTMTNSVEENEVLVFSRANDGSLSHEETVSTEGTGTGMGLGSQGSVILSENGRWLFVVNAGSHQISVFAVGQRGLKLTDIVDSGGEMPISLTVHSRFLYVLNGGGSGNISGFRIRENGKLSPLDSSTQPLSNGGTGESPMPAQVSFNPRGNQLVVTEKATNLIVIYEVNNGIAGPPVTQPSAGITPFGFAFAKRNLLIVSEAFMGEPGASALSSYRVGDDAFEVISSSVGTTQTAACWVVISQNGKYAYDTNTGSGSISSFEIGRDGTLTLLDPQAGLTGEASMPIDMDLSNNGKYLYAIGSGSHAIHIFQVKGDGSLQSLGEVSVPDGSLGLAAR